MSGLELPPREVAQGAPEVPSLIGQKTAEGVGLNIGVQILDIGRGVQDAVKAGDREAALALIDRAHSLQTALFPTIGESRGDFQGYFVAEGKSGALKLAKDFDPTEWNVEIISISIDGKPKDVGFVQYGQYYSDEPHIGVAEYLGVREEVRARGIGSQLLRNAERAMQSAGSTWFTLEVSATNTAMLQFAERNGYQRVTAPQEWIAPGNQEGAPPLKGMVLLAKDLSGEAETMSAADLRDFGKEYFKNHGSKGTIKEATQALQQALKGKTEIELVPITL